MPLKGHLKRGTHPFLRQCERTALRLAASCCGPKVDARRATSISWESRALERTAWEGTYSFPFPSVSESLSGRLLQATARGRNVSFPQQV